MKFGLIAVVPVAVLLLGLVSWFLWDVVETGSAAAFQKTPDWEDWERGVPPGVDVYRLKTDDPSVHAELKPAILIRTSGEGRLLLKHRYDTTTYAYETSSEEIAESNEGEWAAADAAVGKCKPGDYAEPGGNKRTKFEGYPAYEVVADNHPIETYGRFSMFAVESPDHSRVAVLSASGIRIGPGIGYIGLGGSPARIKGRLYIEVIDLNSRERVEPPVRLSPTDDFESYSLCWDSSGHFIVVADYYASFTVVPAN